jgi:23S rRNA (cytosine1962-C5)-methyltransferase
VTDASVTGDRARVAVRVNAVAARHVRAGHPWLYESSITSSPDTAARPGDLAVVFDPQRRFAGVGLWDPTSPIRVRLLHHGQPTTIDATWWRQRLAAAIDRRAPLAQAGTTTGYRLVHGENDGFGGLVVDRYHTTLVLKVYTPAWFPHLPLLVELLTDLTDADRVVLRLARSVRGEGSYVDGATVVGDAPTAPVPFLEHGLTFLADVVHGHKTGHFFDQRDNRHLVAGHCVGKRVLDVCSATGGFTVHGAAAGAVSVRALDVSAAALSTLEANVAANRHLPTVARCRVSTTAGDAFDIMGRLITEGEQFDVVVVDPPSMASNAGQVERAQRAYGRFAEQALRLVADGGVLFQASCTSRVTADDLDTIVQRAARRVGVRLSEMRRTGHALDHPVTFTEGAYLKALLARVRRVSP